MSLAATARSAAAPAASAARPRVAARGPRRWRSPSSSSSSARRAASPSVSARVFGERTPVLFQRLLCAGLGVTVRRHGALERGRRSRLIVANHVSWLDIPGPGLARADELSRQEGGRRSIRSGANSWRCRASSMSTASAGAASPRSTPGWPRRCARGSPVVLFAEATTGDGNRLLRFRSSHFEAIRQAAAEAAGRRAHPAGLSPLFAPRRPADGAVRAAEGRLVRRHDLPAAPRALSSRGGGVDLRRPLRRADPRSRRTWTARPRRA